MITRVKRIYLRLDAKWYGSVVIGFLCIGGGLTFGYVVTTAVIR